MRQKTSWVALDDDGNVVGFLLGQTHPVDMPGMAFSGVELLCGGVQKARRGHARFSGLLGRAKALGMPLYAVVKHSIMGDMAARLLNSGFVKQVASALPGEDAFVWAPSVDSAAER